MEVMYHHLLLIGRKLSRTTPNIAMKGTTVQMKNLTPKKLRLKQKN